MKKELSIFLILFLVLALGMHPDFFTHPLKRISELPQAGAYGLGAIHPLVFGLIGYVVLWIFRGLYRITKRVFNS
jgi:hypothetical protein